MRAGKLKTLLVVQQKTLTPDGMGGSTVTWTEFCQLYGDEIINQAKSQSTADQLSSIQICKWKTRYRAGITPKMRLVAGTRVFEIDAAYDPSRKRERLEIICTELQNPGV